MKKPVFILLILLFNQFSAQEKIIFWPKSAMPELKEPELFAFLPPIKERNPKSVIIIPGGGYSKLTYDEGTFQIAKWMNTQGISAFVLNLPRITQILTNDCAKIKSAKSV